MSDRASSPGSSSLVRVLTGNLQTLLVSVLIALAVAGCGGGQGREVRVVEVVKEVPVEVTKVVIKEVPVEVDQGSTGRGTQRGHRGGPRRRRLPSA